MARPLKWNEEVVTEEARIFEEYINNFEESEESPVISVVNFCASRRYGKQTFYSWIKSEKLPDSLKKELKALTKTCNTAYENSLVNKGLKSKLNTAMCIFLLKAHCGLEDKKSVTHSGEVTHNHFFDEVIKKSIG